MAFTLIASAGTRASAPPAFPDPLDPEPPLPEPEPEPELPLPLDPDPELPEPPDPDPEPDPALPEPEPDPEPEPEPEPELPLPLDPDPELPDPLEPVPAAPGFVLLPDPLLACAVVGLMVTEPQPTTSNTARMDRRQTVQRRIFKVTPRPQNLSASIRACRHYCAGMSGLKSETFPAGCSPRFAFLVCSIELKITQGICIDNHTN
jgi:hypothetical protein